MSTTWKCVSPQHGPDATYRCRCGQTAPGSQIGVTEQARDWFYAPAGQRQAQVTTRGRLPGYRRHNSAAARRARPASCAAKWFQPVDIDPGDPGAADLLATPGSRPSARTFGPSPLRTLETPAAWRDRWLAAGTALSVSCLGAPRFMASANAIP